MVVLPLILTHPLLTKGFTLRILLMLCTMGRHSYSSSYRKWENRRAHRLSHSPHLTTLRRSALGPLRPSALGPNIFSSVGGGRSAAHRGSLPHLVHRNHLPSADCVMLTFLSDPDGGGGDDRDPRAGGGDGEDWFLARARSSSINSWRRRASASGRSTKRVLSRSITSVRRQSCLITLTSARPLTTL